VEGRGLTTQAQRHGQRRFVERELDCLLQARPASDVAWKKVKAHLTYDDVLSGLVAHSDWIGNAAANALAVAGASQWDVGSSERREAWEQASIHIVVQRMMVDILYVRNARKRHQRCDRDADKDDLSSQDSSSESSEEEEEEDLFSEAATEECDSWTLGEARSRSGDAPRWSVTPFIKCVYKKKIKNI